MRIWSGPSAFCGQRPLLSSSGSFIIQWPDAAAVTKAAAPPPSLAAVPKPRMIRWPFQRNAPFFDPVQEFNSGRSPSPVITTSPGSVTSICRSQRPHVSFSGKAGLVTGWRGPVQRPKAVRAVPIHRAGRQLAGTRLPMGTDRCCRHWRKSAPAATSTPRRRAHNSRRFSRLQRT